VKFMKKLVFVSIVAALIIIYVITGALLYTDIQLMEAPETTIKLDFIEINSNETIVNITIQVANPNSLQLITKDFEVVILSEDGVELGRVTIEGGEVPANENETFTETAKLNFHDESPGTITAEISSTLGAKFLGLIKKTISLEVKIITSLEKIIEDIEAPIIHIFADLSDISQEGVNIGASFDVYNPNSFEIHLKNITVDVETETGEPVGDIDVAGGTIKPRSSSTFNGTGITPIEVLNAETLLIDMNALVGAKISGFNKTISINMDAEIKMPDLRDLLPSENPTDIIVRSDYKITGSGILIDMTLEVTNPNKITLVLKDLIVTFELVKGDQELLIGTANFEDSGVPINSSINLDTQVTLPYTKLFFSEGGILSADGILIMLRGNVTIPGVGYSIWIGVGEYQDLNFFR